MLGKRKGHISSIAPSKRKRSVSAIEEITFDFGAREDYLSGFHKRKVQRIKQAREEAVKKEREERVIARKLLREGRKADLEQHVEAVNALLRKADEGESSASDEDDTDDEQWNGLQQTPVVDQEAEYEDEDRHTTVTIEAVDVTREGLQKVTVDNEESGDENSVQRGKKIPNSQAEEGGITKTKRIWTKERPGGPKKKKQKFKYETKAERKVTRHKERSGNKAKAKARKE
ncbi:hypothetical protein MMC19_002773 [Ptychographa xylographoides]|nr:hypothetical protein [Ptychographa xylographoides]